jgi:hypothetical protein
MRRIKVSDLEEAAHDLSLATGETFLIRPSWSGCGWDLRVAIAGTSSSNNVRTCMTPAALFDWICTYHAGIDHGLRVAESRRRAAAAKKAARTRRERSKPPVPAAAARMMAFRPDP